MHTRSGARSAGIRSRFAAARRLLRRELGFTTAELLLAVSILGLLILAAVPTMTGAATQAKDAAPKTHLTAIERALRQIAYEGNVEGFPVPSDLAAALDELEVAFNYEVGVGWQSAEDNGTSEMITIDTASTPLQALLYSRSDSGNVYRLRVVIPPTGEAVQAVLLPQVMALPEITGQATVGKALNVTSGTWLWNPTEYSYTWLRCNLDLSSCSEIPGSNGAAHILTVEDQGYRILAEVTASNFLGSTPARSLPIGVVGPGASAPVNLVAPSITGQAYEGGLLTADPGVWQSDYSAGYDYQWYRCDAEGANCAAIVGADGYLYVPTSADIDSTVKFEVTATNLDGFVTVASSPTVAIGNAIVTTAVGPIVECIEPTGGGWYTAHYGYNNAGTTPIVLPAGQDLPGITNDNLFRPNPKDRGQPSVYPAGRWHDLFTDPFKGAAAIWRISGVNTNINSQTPQCTFGVPTSPSQTSWVLSGTIQTLDSDVLTLQVTAANWHATDLVGETVTIRIRPHTRFVVGSSIQTIASFSVGNAVKVYSRPYSDDGSALAWQVSK